MHNKELFFSITKGEFEIQSFKASGPGGQHRNKNETAIRIIHKNSGASSTCKEFKSQSQNRKKAFERLINSEKFSNWLRIKVSEKAQNKTIEEKVDEEMKEENLKIEIQENGKWKTKN